MKTKLILRIAVALCILMAAGSVVAACVGIARAINRGTVAVDIGQELSAPYLSSQVMAGDDLFTPDFLAVTIDRSDVPWQASGVEDPDNVRSF